MGTRQTVSVEEYREFVWWLASAPEVGDTIVYRDDGHGYKEAEIILVDDDKVVVIPADSLFEKTWTRKNWHYSVWMTGAILPLRHVPPLPDLTDNQIALLGSLVGRAREHETIHIYLGDRREPIAVCGFCHRELDGDGAIRKGHSLACEGERLRMIAANLAIWQQERWGDTRRREENAKKGRG